jgi:hypothetical protein
MKTRTSILIAVFCFTLVLSGSAWTQNYNRARQAAEEARNAASANSMSAPERGFENRFSSPEAAVLEYFVPRAGMQLYFEVRRQGFAQLMQSDSALAPLVRMLVGQAKVSSQDFAAFALSQAGALRNSRLALVSYGGNDVAAIIETGGSADGEAIKTSLAKMMISSRSGSVEMDVRRQDRLVLAGAKTTVAKLADSEGQFALSEDRMFMKMRERFSDDPFFAYMEYPSVAQMMPGAGDQTTAAMASMLTGLGNQPYAVAMGGSLHGDMTRLRALALFTANDKGAFSGLFSSATSTGKEMVGATFAAPDSDMFLSLSINWDKLYDSMQSMFGMMAGAMAGTDMPQGRVPPGTDLFAMMESQLGFSIRHDLLPTLGNQLAISFSDFGKIMKPVAQPDDYQSPRPRPALPRILVMVELRDQARFLQLFNRLLNPPARPQTQLAEEMHRGVTIKHGPSVAFAVSKGFFLFAPTAAEIRRALDARALGNSLASSADFRAAVGASDQASMQAYFSSGMTGELLKTMFAEAAKSNEALKGFATVAARTRSSIGLTMKDDSDGMMMEMRVPTNLAFMAMASMSATKPMPYGISTTSGKSRAGGRRTPKMTDEDVKVVRRR